MAKKEAEARIKIDKLLQEADLIASKRYKLVRTENNRRIYVEITTGREVPVIIPELMFKSKFTRL